MAKEEQSNQLNLTVVALVALVAIVGLVALVMNAASIAKLPTGSQIVSAEDNIAGQAYQYGGRQVLYADYSDWGGGYGASCQKENQGCSSKLKCCSGLTCVQGGCENI